MKIFLGVVSTCGTISNGRSLIQVHAPVSHKKLTRAACLHLQREPKIFLYTWSLSAKITISEMALFHPSYFQDFAAYRTGIFNFRCFCRGKFHHQLLRSVQLLPLLWEWEKCPQNSVAWVLPCSPSGVQWCSLRCHHSTKYRSRGLSLWWLLDLVSPVNWLRSLVNHPFMLQLYAMFLAFHLYQLSGQTYQGTESADDENT